MKHVTQLLIFGIILLFTWSPAFIQAQSPERFSYQAVMRDANDDLLRNTAVGIRIQILEESAFGSAVYVETQSANTNTNGLVSLVIGDGNVVQGDLANVDWANKNHFIKTEVDPTGGDNYSLSGTSELLSVPYALYAAAGGEPGPQGPQGPEGPQGPVGPEGPEGPQGLLPNGITGAIPYWTGSNWRVSSTTLYHQGNRIGLGTTSPDDGFHIHNNRFRFSHGGKIFRLENSDGGALVCGTVTANTFALLSNGTRRMQIRPNGDISFGAPIGPDTDIHLYHGTLPTSATVIDHGLRVQNEAANDNHWTLYTVNSSGNLQLYSKAGGTDVIGSFNNVTGSYSSTSNRAFKKNISSLGKEVVNKIMKLDPSQYSFKRDVNNQMTFGFIAEDVQDLFPELVEKVGEKEENLALNYAGFSVLAIKGIQLQQNTIDDLKSQVEKLEKVVAEREERFVALERKVQELEAMLMDQK